MRFTGMGGIRGLAGIGMGNMFLCMGGLGGGGGLGRWSSCLYGLLVFFLFVVRGLYGYGVLGPLRVDAGGVYSCRWGCLCLC
jgi:hypothetical protein